MDNRNAGETLSIIIPVYNEARVIENVVRGFYEKVVKQILNAKLIIVEDGSTDGTKEILNKLNREIPFVLMSSKQRKGYTKAFKYSVGIAKTELIFFSDSDGQHDPTDIFKLLREIDKSDIVSGYKFPRHDPIHRIIISKAYNFLIHLLFGLKLNDIDSGFKLIKKKVVDNVLNDVMHLKYCVMSEFVLKAYLSGYKIKEIPVNHYPRKSGRTVIFTPTQLPLIIIGLIRDLFKIRFDYIKEKKQ
jgi:glycosyltransferase involved in cell wall biosynthesis